MICVLCLVALFPFRASGPLTVNFERVKFNTEAWIAAHPADASGYEVLGRAHMLTYLRGRDSISGDRFTYDNVAAEGLLTGIDLQRNTERDNRAPLRSRDAFRSALWAKRGALPWVPTPAESLDHIAQAVSNLHVAVQLAPESARTHLALAYACEKFAHMAPWVDSSALFGINERDLDREELFAWDALLSDEGAVIESALMVSGIEEWCVCNWKYLDPLRVDARPLVQGRAAKLLSDSWTSWALLHYRRAFELAAPEDSKLQYIERSLTRGTNYSEIVAFEAGEAIERLAPRFDSADMPLRALLAAVRPVMARLLALGPEPRRGTRAVSPLVISFTTADPSAMITVTSRVCFDLDGRGNVGPWPWPRADTALVVWDPERRGVIESGRDLLGEGSFGLFPRDGFAALSILDDDHDGWVSGGELDGLRLWFDRDCDGESKPDEMHDLNEFGVIALCCADARSTAAGLVHPEGVLLRTGRRLPLVDWIASPHPETYR